MSRADHQDNTKRPWVGRSVQIITRLPFFAHLLNMHAQCGDTVSDGSNLYLRNG